jgi:hypothetical protein
VAGVVKSGTSYDAAQNHDVDGGTSGSTITVTR